MTTLSTHEIARMRTTVNASLPGTAVIQSKAGTSDGGGGGSLVWSAFGTVSCRLSPNPRMGHEVEIGDRLTPETHWIVTVPALTTVDETNRFLIAGRVYNIARVKAPMDFEVTRRVEVIEEFS